MREQRSRYALVKHEGRLNSIQERLLRRAWVEGEKKKRRKVIDKRHLLPELLPFLATSHTLEGVPRVSHDHWYMLYGLTYF